MTRRTAEDEAPQTRLERKKEAQAYGSLSERIVKDANLQLPDPPFDDELRDEIALARRSVKNARSRLIRRVAQLLPGVGSVEEIQAVLDGQTEAQRAEKNREIKNERWRARLLEEGDAGLSAFVEAHPGCDRARMRQLMRQASKSPGDPRSKGAARTLLREIRAVTAPDADPQD